MDFFGIGQALMGCFNVYINASRSTGRTINLVNSLEDGDRVICVCEKDARILENLSRKRGIEINTLVVDPKWPNFDGIGTSQKRTIFDHRYVELFHERSLYHSISALKDLEENLSGYGAKHRETKAKAQEMAKWRI